MQITPLIKLIRNVIRQDEAGKLIPFPILSENTELNLKPVSERVIGSKSYSIGLVKLSAVYFLGIETVNSASSRDILKTRYFQFFAFNKTERF